MRYESISAVLAAASDNELTGVTLFTLCSLASATMFVRASLTPYILPFVEEGSFKIKRFLPPAWGVFGLRFDLALGLVDLDLDLDLDRLGPRLGPRPIWTATWT